MKISDQLSQGAGPISLSDEKGRHQRDIQEPLLQAEGGEGSASALLDSHHGDIVGSSVQQFRSLDKVPDQIPIKNELLDYASNLNPHVKDMPYEIFKQAYFDYQTVTIESPNVAIQPNHSEPDPDPKYDDEESRPMLAREFKIDELAKELDHVDNINKTNQEAHLSIKREYDMGVEGPPQFEEPFKQFIEYDIDNRRPDYDASQEEHFLNRYIDKFWENIQSNDIYKVVSLDRDGKKEGIEKTEINVIIDDLKKIYKRQDTQLKDDDESGQSMDEEEQQVHKSLIASSNLEMGKWIIEVRKIFHIHDDKLQLELRTFSEKGETQEMGHIQIADLSKVESYDVFKIMKNNFENLFNHILIGNKLYFFKLGEDLEELSMHYFEIKDLQTHLSEDTIVQIDDCSFQMEETTIMKTKYNVMGAFFVKDLEKRGLDENHPSTYNQIVDEDGCTPTNVPNAFFALILGSRHNQESIYYDIRHTKDPKRSIAKEEVHLSQDDEIKGEPFLVKIPASKIFYQMMMTKKITNEDMNKMKKKILEYQVDENLRSKKAVTNPFASQKPKFHLTQGLNDLTMIAVAFLNDTSIQSVSDITFINKSDKQIQAKDLLKVQDQEDLKDTLKEYLLMYSMRHTCNVVKFDSQHQIPVVQEKKFCRGQIELIKRLFKRVRNENRKQNSSLSESMSKTERKRRLSQSIQRSADDDNDENLDYLYDESDRDQDDKIFEVAFDFFNCATLIDLVSNVMIISLYHRTDQVYQYVLKVGLKNYNYNYIQKEIKPSENVEKANNYFKLKGYNKMFWQSFNRSQSENTEEFGTINLNQKRLIISKKFDNVMRDMDNLIWSHKDQLLLSEDKEYDVIPLKSRLLIMDTNHNYKQEPTKDYNHFIKVLFDDKDPSKPHHVETFINYTNNQLRTSNYRLNMNQERRQSRQLPVSLSTSKVTDFKKTIHAADMSIKEYDFHLKNIVLQNVITVEDDRADIPMLSVGDDYKSLHFAIVRYTEIKAIATIQLNTKEFVSTIDSQYGTFYQNYANYFQLCASSDIQEGIPVENNGKKYLYQNYTVSIFFQRQLRFQMHEFQVKWIPNSDEETMKDDPYTVEMNLIKIRETIFKKFAVGSQITEYLLVPLFEKLTYTNDSQEQMDKAPYQITGTQLILNYKSGYTDTETKKADKPIQCFFDFRSLLDTQRYGMFEQHVNYRNRFTISRTHMIDQQNIEGVFAETEFRHTREGELRSDYVNTVMFDDQQSYTILKEVNTQALNSFPMDFIGLMDLPEINEEWFKREQMSFNIDQTSRSMLDTNKIFREHYKRYFCAHELLNGFQMLNRIGLLNEDETDEEENRFSVRNRFNPFAKSKEIKIKKFNRDPQAIKKLFERINKQQDDRRYDFKQIKDFRTPIFTLPLIERVLTGDIKLIRFFNFRRSGLILEGKDIIGSNMDMQSVIQYPIRQGDEKLAEIYIRELFENNEYSPNKYSQMMRIMPLVLGQEGQGLNIKQFFKFFIDQDLQVNNDEVDREDEADDEEDLLLDNEFFKEEELPEFITFDQFFPQKLQEKIDRYTNIKCQIFTDNTSDNLKYLNHSDSMNQAFKHVFDEKRYKSDGSEYEVKASLIDFKPYVLGQQIQAIEQAQNINDIKLANKLQMDNYKVAQLCECVLEKTPGQINEQKTIRDIIDNLFITTQKFFYFNLAFYFFGYFLPLIMQMRCPNEQRVIYYNVSCLIVQVYCLIYELIALKAEKCAYFKNKWNFLDLTIIFLYFGYFLVRMQYPVNLIPSLPEDKGVKYMWVLDVDNLNEDDMKNTLKHEQDEYLVVYCAPIHVLLIFTAFMKLMFFFRVQEDFGRFVQLVMSCIDDVKIFLFFFVVWVLIFGILFEVSGVTFSGEDYPTLKYLSFYFQTYRNSIGDIGTPQYKYWEQMKESDKSQKFGYSQWMIYIIWILWFLNQFFNLIILMNFLIAIVTQSYERVISNIQTFAYNHRSELNCETQRFFHIFRTPEPFDIMCQISSHEDDLTNESDIEGLTQNLKKFIKTHKKKLLEDMTKRFERSEKVATKIDMGIKQYVDLKFGDFIQKIQEIKGDVTTINGTINKGLGGSQADDVEEDDYPQQILGKIEQIASDIKKEKSDREKDIKSMKSAIEGIQFSEMEAKEVADAKEQVLKAREEAQEAKEVETQIKDAGEQAQEQLDQAITSNQTMKSKIDSFKDETVEELQKKFNANQEALQNQTKKLDDLQQVLEKLTQSFPAVVEESRQSLTNDFEQKLSQIKQATPISDAPKDDDE